MVLVCRVCISIIGPHREPAERLSKYHDFGWNLLTGQTLACFPDLDLKIRVRKPVVCAPCAATIRSFSILRMRVQETEKILRNFVEFDNQCLHESPALLAKYPYGRFMDLVAVASMVASAIDPIPIPIKADRILQYDEDGNLIAINNWRDNELIPSLNETACAAISTRTSTAENKLIKQLVNTERGTSSQTVDMGADSHTFQPAIEQIPKFTETIKDISTVPTMPTSKRKTPTKNEPKSINKECVGSMEDSLTLREETNKLCKPIAKCTKRQLAEHFPKTSSVLDESSQSCNSKEKEGTVLLLDNPKNKLINQRTIEFQVEDGSPQEFSEPIPKETLFEYTAKGSDEKVCVSENSLDTPLITDSECKHHRNHSDSSPDLLEIYKEIPYRAPRAPSSCKKLRHSRSLFNVSRRKRRPNVIKKMPLITSVVSLSSVDSNSECEVGNNNPECEHSGLPSSKDTAVSGSPQSGEPLSDIGDTTVNDLGHDLVEKRISLMIKEASAVHDSVSAMIINCQTMLGTAVNPEQSASEATLSECPTSCSTEVNITEHSKNDYLIQHELDSVNSFLEKESFVKIQTTPESPGNITTRYGRRIKRTETFSIFSQNRRSVSTAAKPVNRTVSPDNLSLPVRIKFDGQTAFLEGLKLKLVSPKKRALKKSASSPRKVITPGSSNTSGIEASTKNVLDVDNCPLTVTESAPIISQINKTDLSLKAVITSTAEPKLVQAVKTRPSEINAEVPLGIGIVSLEDLNDDRTTDLPDYNNDVVEATSLKTRRGRQKLIETNKDVETSITAASMSIVEIATSSQDLSTIETPAITSDDALAEHEHISTPRRGRSNSRKDLIKPVVFPDSFKDSSTETAEDAEVCKIIGEVYSKSYRGRSKSRGAISESSADLYNMKGLPITEATATITTEVPAQMIENVNKEVSKSEQVLDKGRPKSRAGRPKSRAGRSKSRNSNRKSIVTVDNNEDTPVTEATTTIAVIPDQILPGIESVFVKMADEDNTKSRRCRSRSGNSNLMCAEMAGNNEDMPVIKGTITIPEILPQVISDLGKELSPIEQMFDEDNIKSRRVRPKSRNSNRKSMLTIDNKEDKPVTEETITVPEILPQVMSDLTKELSPINLKVDEDNIKSRRVRPKSRNSNRKSMLTVDNKEDEPVTEETITIPVVPAQVASEIATGISTIAQMDYEDNIKSRRVRPKSRNSNRKFMLTVDNKEDEPVTEETITIPEILPQVMSDLTKELSPIEQMVYEDNIKSRRVRPKSRNSNRKFMLTVDNKEDEPETEETITIPVVPAQVASEIATGITTIEQMVHEDNTKSRKVRPKSRNANWRPIVTADNKEDIPVSDGSTTVALVPAQVFPDFSKEDPAGMQTVDEAKLKSRRCRPKSRNSNLMCAEMAGNNEDTPVIEGIITIPEAPAQVVSDVAKQVYTIDNMVDQDSVKSGRVRPKSRNNNPRTIITADNAEDTPVSGGTNVVAVVPPQVLSDLIKPVPTGGQMVYYDNFKSGRIRPKSRNNSPRTTVLLDNNEDAASITEGTTTIAMVSAQILAKLTKKDPTIGHIVDANVKSRRGRPKSRNSNPKSIDTADINEDVQGTIVVAEVPAQDVSDIAKEVSTIAQVVDEDNIKPARGRPKSRMSISKSVSELSLMYYYSDVSTTETIPITTEELTQMVEERVTVESMVTESNLKSGNDTSKSNKNSTKSSLTINEGDDISKTEVTSTVSEDLTENLEHSSIEGSTTEALKNSKFKKSRSKSTGCIPTSSLCIDSNLHTQTTEPGTSVTGGRIEREEGVNDTDKNATTKRGRSKSKGRTAKSSTFLDSKHVVQEAQETTAIIEGLSQSIAQIDTEKKITYRRGRSKSRMRELQTAVSIDSKDVVEKAEETTAIVVGPSGSIEQKDAEENATSKRGRSKSRRRASKSSVPLDIEKDIQAAEVTTAIAIKAANQIIEQNVNEVPTEVVAAEDSKPRRGRSKSRIRVSKLNLRLDGKQDVLETAANIATIESTIAAVISAIYEVSADTTIKNIVTPDNSELRIETKSQSIKDTLITEVTTPIAEISSENNENKSKLIRDVLEPRKSILKTATSLHKKRDVPVTERNISSAKTPAEIIKRNDNIAATIERVISAKNLQSPSDTSTFHNDASSLPVTEIAPPKIIYEDNSQSSASSSNYRSGISQSDTLLAEVSSGEFSMLPNNHEQSKSEKKPPKSKRYTNKPTVPADSRSVSITECAANVAEAVNEQDDNKATKNEPVVKKQRSKFKREIFLSENDTVLSLVAKTPSTGEVPGEPCSENLKIIASKSTNKDVTLSTKCTNVPASTSKQVDDEPITRSQDVNIAEVPILLSEEVVNKGTPKTRKRKLKSVVNTNTPVTTANTATPAVPNLVNEDDSTCRNIPKSAGSVNDVNKADPSSANKSTPRTRRHSMKTVESLLVKDDALPTLTTEISAKTNEVVFNEPIGDVEKSTSTSEDQVSTKSLDKSKSASNEDTPLAAEGAEHIDKVEVDGDVPIIEANAVPEEVSTGIPGRTVKETTSKTGKCIEKSVVPLLLSSDASSTDVKEISDQCNKGKDLEDDSEKTIRVDGEITEPSDTPIAKNESAATNFAQYQDIVKDSEKIAQLNVPFLVKESPDAETTAIVKVGTAISTEKTEPEKFTTIDASILSDPTLTIGSSTPKCTTEDISSTASPPVVILSQEELASNRLINSDNSDAALNAPVEAITKLQPEKVVKKDLSLAANLPKTCAIKLPKEIVIVISAADQSLARTKLKAEASIPIQTTATSNCDFLDKVGQAEGATGGINNSSASGQSGNTSKAKEDVNENLISQLERFPNDLTSSTESAPSELCTSAQQGIDGITKLPPVLSPHEMAPAYFNSVFLEDISNDAGESLEVKQLDAPKSDVTSSGSGTSECNDTAAVSQQVGTSSNVVQIESEGISSSKNEEIVGHLPVQRNALLNDVNLLATNNETADDITKKVSAKCVQSECILESTGPCPFLDICTENICVQDTFMDEHVISEDMTECPFKSTDKSSQPDHTSETTVTELKVAFQVDEILTKSNIVCDNSRDIKEQSPKHALDGGKPVELTHDDIESVLSCFVKESSNVRVQDDPISNSIHQSEGHIPDQSKTSVAPQISTDNIVSRQDVANYVISCLVQEATVLKDCTGATGSKFQFNAPEEIVESEEKSPLIFEDPVMPTAFPKASTQKRSAKRKCKALETSADSSTNKSVDLELPKSKLRKVANSRKNAISVKMPATPRKTRKQNSKFVQLSPFKGTPQDAAPSTSMVSTPDGNSAGDCFLESVGKSPMDETLCQPAVMPSAEATGIPMSQTLKEFWAEFNTSLESPGKSSQDQFIDSMCLPEVFAEVTLPYLDDDEQTLCVGGSDLEDITPTLIAEQKVISDLGCITSAGEAYLSIEDNPHREVMISIPTQFNSDATASIQQINNLCLEDILRSKVTCQTAVLTSEDNTSGDYIAEALPDNNETYASSDYLLETDQNISESADSKALSKPIPVLLSISGRSGRQSIKIMKVSNAVEDSDTQEESLEGSDSISKLVLPANVSSRENVPSEMSDETSDSNSTSFQQNTSFSPNNSLMLLVKPGDVLESPRNTQHAAGNFDNKSQSIILPKTSKLLLAHENKHDLKSPLILVTVPKDVPQVNSNSRAFKPTAERPPSNVASTQLTVEKPVKTKGGAKKSVGKVAAKLAKTATPKRPVITGWLNQKISQEKSKQQETAKPSMNSEALRNKMLSKFSIQPPRSPKASTNIASLKTAKREPAKDFLTEFSNYLLRDSFRKDSMDASSQVAKMSSAKPKPLESFTSVTLPPLTAACSSSQDVTIEHTQYPNRKYSCDICQFEFPVESLLKKHKEWHCKWGGLYECKYCVSRYDSLEQLNSHAALHRKVYKYDHMKNVSLPSEAEELCPDCGRLVAVSVLPFHLDWHEPESQVQCRVCNVSVLRMDRQMHWNDHHRNNNLFFCSICGESYSTKQTLCWHLEKHSIKCRLCGMKIGETECGQHVCPKNTRPPYKRRKHQKMLAMLRNTKHFKCKSCAKAFYSRDHLRIHSYRQHKECDQCGQICFTEIVLQAHKIKVHDIDINAQFALCTRSYKSNSEIIEEAEREMRRVARQNRAHSKSSSPPTPATKRNKKITCDICGHVCQTYASLSTHRRCHLKRRRQQQNEGATCKEGFACRFCSVVFDTMQTRTEHMAIHTGASKRSPINRRSPAVTTGHHAKHQQVVRSTAVSLPKLLQEKLSSPLLTTNEVSSDDSDVPLLTGDRLGTTKQKIDGSTVTDHICKICDKKFKSLKQLRIHINIHSGIKNFNCMQCDKHFFTKAGLQEHESKCHPPFHKSISAIPRQEASEETLTAAASSASVISLSPRRTHACHCGEQFLSLATLRKHKVLKHPKPLAPNVATHEANVVRAPVSVDIAAFHALGQNRKHQ